MTKIQIRITTEIKFRPEYNRDTQVYIIEAQSVLVAGRIRLEVLYPDHADLLVDAMKIGASLAGIGDGEIVVFYPDDWGSILQLARDDRA